MATNAAPTEPTVMHIPLASIFPSIHNPRKHFDHAKLKELAASITAHGVLEPLLVRPDPMDANQSHPKKYELVVGERRWRAAKLANKTEIMATVRHLSDRETLEIMVIENSQRADVTPLEEARGYQMLMTLEATGDLQPHTATSIAAKVGKSEGFVYARLKLLSLVRAGVEALDQQHITPGHAILIARLQPAEQLKALRACFNSYHPDYNGKGVEPEKVKLDDVIDTMSILDGVLIPEKALREWIQDNVNLKLKGVPWDLSDPTLLPEAGACTTCPKRSESNPALFQELAVKGEDTCFDPICYQAKREAYVQIEIAKDQDKARAGKVTAEEHVALRQLSEKSGYTEVKPDQKVLKAGQWLDAKKGSCSSAEQGIIVQGENMGARKWVCCNGACKVHKHSLSGSSSGGSVPKTDYKLHQFQCHKEEIKAKKAAVSRSQLARQIVAKVGAKIPEEILRSIVAENTRGEHTNLLWLMGMDRKAARAANFGKVLNKAKGQQLNQIVVASLLQEYSRTWGDPDPRKRSEMSYLAKAAGLKNPQTILSGQDERLDKAQSCRACGCTEEAACELDSGGKYITCSWKEPDLCSNPDCTTYDPKAKTQTAAKPAKKGKKS